MKVEVIDLYKYFNLKRADSNVKGYLTCLAHTELTEILPVKCIRPAMLILPGGGYTFVSQREDEPIALKFLDDGYNTFTLDYTVNVPYPTQLLETFMAMAYIRRNAKEFCIDTTKVCVVGFSAGGHLAGTLSTLYSEQDLLEKIGCTQQEVKPDAVILSYAVLSFNDTYTHSVTRGVITGGNKDLIKKLDVINNVTKNTPPTFIWATKQDDLVPVENSIKYALSLQEKGVSFELHVFENGWHGLSTGDEVSNYNDKGEGIKFECAKWITLSKKWLSNRGFKVRYYK